ncbi:unnamed protein product [Rhizophagus irregularis]|nr:unnamed protein product [Rhizophagus irregularis]
MISINKLVEHEATDTCIWIERWIDNLQLKSDLQEARNTLQHRSKVNFYTDAIRNVKACLFHCPSSTRAELVAILLALLASPCASTVRMHTDSQAAIQSISNIQHLSSKELLKRNTFLFYLK